MSIISDPSRVASERPSMQALERTCSWCHQDNKSVHPIRKGKVGQSPALCPICHRPILLVSIQQASQLVNRSRKTIYQWIGKRRITAVRGANGRLYICSSSLFWPQEVTDPSDDDV